jgi:hypothetical protein
LSGENRFLWVALVLDEILRQPNPKAMKQSLEFVPHGLFELYENIWRKLQDQDEKEVQRIEYLLAILIIAQKPVEISEIESVVKTLQGEDLPFDGSKWSLYSTSFVEVDLEDRVQFIHFTVEEFLLSKDILGRIDADAIRLLLSPLHRPVQAQLSTPESEVNLQHDDDDFDDTASRNSWSSRSFSAVSSKSSQSSVFSKLETVTDQYAQLFADHPDTSHLIVKILGAIGRSGFELFFSDILIQYSNELQVIAKTGSEQVAALMAGKNTRTIAYQTVLISGFLDPTRIVRNSITAEEKAGKERVLNRFLGLRDHDKIQEDEKHPPIHFEDSTRPIPMESARDDLTSKEVTLEQEDQGEVYVNLEKVKVFLTTTYPFIALVEKLQQKLQPSRVIPPILPPQGSKEISTDRSWYSGLERAARKKILRLIPGRESTLEPGMKRVRWTRVTYPIPQFHPGPYSQLAGMQSEIL